MRIAPLVLVAFVPLAACSEALVTAPLAPVPVATASLAAAPAATTPLPTTSNSAPVVRIRGPDVISANSRPLFIVDGVTLNDLNPADITAIEIVKGPAMATLYGTGTSCPAIIIRTKPASTQSAQPR